MLYGAHRRITVAILGTDREPRSAPVPPCLVQTVGLRASYRGVFRHNRVLVDVNVSAEPGEITAIIGPNGAGKTTLFMVLLGFLLPDGGSCLVGGMRPGEYRRRRGVGYLPQATVFPRAWTARDILARSAALFPASSRCRAFDTALEAANLDSSTLSKPASRCSHGVQRRLGLALALAGEPSFVVLDEPFAGLDPAARADMRRQMLIARSRGATVLFASHELGEVERMSQRAFILESGVSRLTANSTSDLETQLLSNHGEGAAIR